MPSLKFELYVSVSEADGYIHTWVYAVPVSS